MTDAPTWINERFHRRVVPAVFGTAEAARSPGWIGIGGQPGAGKTAARETAFALNHGVQPVEIIGDDLRRLHPDYDRLMREDPLRMPEATQDAVNAWVELALTYARENRYSVLVEGTFRRPEVTLDTAAAFHEAGYQTQLIAVAVPPWESRLSTLERYVNDHREGRTARWTPTAAHDEGVRGTPRTLEAAATDLAVDRISIVTRRGEILFDQTRPDNLAPAARVLARVHNATPEPAIRREWESRARTATDYVRRELPRTTETALTLRALTADATRATDEPRLFLAG